MSKDANVKFNVIAGPFEKTQKYLNSLKNLKTDSTIMIFIEKTGLGYQPAFKIGVQSFHLDAEKRKSDARWYCNMLFHAFTVLAKPEPGSTEIKFNIIKSLK